MNLPGPMQTRATWIRSGFQFESKGPIPIQRRLSIHHARDWYSFSAFNARSADCFSNAFLIQESIRTHRIPLFQNSTNPPLSTALQVTGGRRNKKKVGGSHSISLRSFLPAQPRGAAIIQPMGSTICSFWSQ